MSAVNITFPGNVAVVQTPQLLRSVPTAITAPNALYIVQDLGGGFTFDPGSTAADDGTDVIRPLNIAPLQSGRWLKIIDTLPDADAVAGLITGRQNTFIAGTASPQFDATSQTFQNSAKTATDIYSPVSAPGFFYNDTGRFVAEIQPGCKAQHIAAVGAYTVNYAPVGPTPGERNAVGYWHLGVCAVDGSRTWGINTACIDSLTNDAGQTLTGRQMLGWEADFQCNGASEIVGAAFIIQGTGTPFNADALQVSARFANNGVAKWTNGFVTGDACVTNAMSIGAQAASGNNVNSQPAYFNVFSSTGVRNFVGIQATSSGAFTINSSIHADNIALATGTGNVYIIAGGPSDNCNVILQPKGGGQVRATNVLVADAGLQLPNGNVSQLPTPSSDIIGLQRFVIDASAVTYRGNAVGGGTERVVVTCDGINWRYM